MRYLILMMFCIGCSTTRPSHKIMDREKYVHDYNKQIYQMNETLTLYCKSHYRWEKVRMINTKHGTLFIVGALR